MQTDKDSREDILKVFSLFDVEGKGKITVRDLKRVAKELGETMTGAFDAVAVAVVVVDFQRNAPNPRPPTPHAQRRSSWR